MRMTLFRVMLVALGALWFGQFVPSAQASAPLTQISSDPFTNPSGQHATEVEPGSFAYGSTIVAAFQEGRFATIGGASDIGFATSTNGGASWAQGSLPLTKFSGGLLDRVSDPSVAYDAKAAVWLIASLAVDDTGVGNAVVVDRSTDGGRSWGDPVTVAAAPPHGDLDKPWISCDDTPTSAFYGRCYAEWDNAAQSQNVELSMSSDGGLTWGSATTPANPSDAAGGQPLVQPNGAVVVPITDAGNQLSAFRSLDGGATWSNEFPISVVQSHPVAGGLRADQYILSSAQIDGKGRVYVAWQDCRFRANCSSNDIVFSTSTDGLIWSPVTRVPIDPVTSSVDHFLPGLAVDRSTSGAGAHLALTYYYYPQTNCDPSTCQLDAGFVSSTDGGATWSAPVQLAGPMSLSWLAATGSGPMVGDYISTSFTSDGLAHGVFAVAKPPTGGRFDEAMYTTTAGLRPASPGQMNCVVPKVVGEKLARAKAAIEKHDCRTGSIRRANSPKVRKGHVIAQKPKPHTVLTAGGKVNLVVSRGRKR
jgi:hypothetical protein